MKKLLAVLLALLLMTASACAEDALRVIALKGPTAMGMVQVMDRTDNGDLQGKFSFTIAAAIDEVTPQIAQGSVDVAAVPANLASVLYNKTEGGVQVIGINTLGVIYIVENGDTVHSVEDLRGRTIYASGKGATPEYALNYILSANGIDPEKDVTIEWKSEHAECLQTLIASGEGIAMLPQPFVTTAQTKLESLRIALDLTEEWDRLQEGQENPSALLTGVVIVRTEYAAEHPQELEAFLEAYRASVEYVNSDVEGAAALVGAYDIVPEAVARKALPACNIVLIEGEEMVSKLGGYLGELYRQNPASVGGKLPEADFYHVK